MLLNEIDHDFLSENKETECKARLDRKDVLGWLKTIDGFANAKGGCFYIGVEDKSYKLIGLDSSQADKEKLFFFHTLEEHMPVLPQTEIKEIPYEVHGKTLYILKIRVFESKQKPLLLKYEGMPMTFVRRDGYTNAATMEELHDMAASFQKPTFDTQITDVSYQRSDYSKLLAFSAERSQGVELSDKVLSGIGFFDKNRFMKKGALLFKDDCQEKNTRLVCSLFRGITKGDDMIISSNSFVGNLIDSYHFADDFIQSRMNHGFIKTDNSRIDIDSFPKRAVFEALINALAHRDYLMDGTQIDVCLFKDRLSISTPGSMYDVGEIKPTRNLQSFVSRRRNELISAVFVACHAMEAKGTGFEKIEKEYEKADEKHQPYIYSKNNQVTLVLPDLTYSEGVMLSDESLMLKKPVENSSKYDLRILSYCFYNKRTVKEITDYVGTSDSTFFRKSILENLVKQNFLNVEKSGRTSYYITDRQNVELN